VVSGRRAVGVATGGRERQEPEADAGVQQRAEGPQPGPGALGQLFGGPALLLDPGEEIQLTGGLGEGGMGEVYRATDSKLGREVAIKLLPEAVAGVCERLARFDREARVLAALDHPNPAAI
jgi:hypothetical protein